MQAARSVGHTLARKESESATLIRLHTLASGYQARYGGNPPWAEIKKSIARTRPPCADKLDTMITFLVARSGGVQGGFMKYLVVFHRNFVEDSLRGGVPAKLYSALADFSDDLHYVALAIFETAWTCPPAHVRNLMCEWVGAVEVLALSKTKDEKQRELLGLANEMLSKSRSMTDKSAWQTYIRTYVATKSPSHHVTIQQINAHSYERTAYVRTKSPSRLVTKPPCHRVAKSNQLLFSSRCLLRTYALVAPRKSS